MGSGVADSDGLESPLSPLALAGLVQPHGSLRLITLSDPTRGCLLGSLARALLRFVLVPMLQGKATIPTCPEREGTCPRSPRGGVSPLAPNLAMGLHFQTGPTKVKESGPQPESVLPQFPQSSQLAETSCHRPMFIVAHTSGHIPGEYFMWDF